MQGISSKAQWLIAFFVLWIFSCSDEQPTHPPAYSYQIPAQTNDDWQTASLAKVGLDAGIISEAIDRINYGLYRNIHGVLIVKNGKLVFEEYFSGANFGGNYTEFDRNTLHYLASDTKSFTSALVGLAVDRDFIINIDTTVFAFLPQHADLRTAEKDKLTIEHFLTMSAGLQYDEWSYPYTDSRNDHVRMNNSSDPVRFVLGLPVEAEPGTKFVYNSGLSITLGAIIEKASGLRLNQFAQTYLFSPLQITNYYWYQYPNGTFQTGGGLNMLPRDMAKFGQLYLNGGVWNGARIISQEWVARSTSAHISVDSYWNYGYQWWLRTYQLNTAKYPSFSARGWGGQYIIVFPDFEMVLVFTGGNYSTPDPVDDMIVRFILPALR